MSELKTYISAISEGFRELESSKEFRNYADFYKKYSNFIDFYSEKFDGSEKPEHEEVLEELAEQFNEKRHELLLFLAERTKHIPGLSKDGKLTETAQSFVLHQIDNNLMLNPPEPLIPSNKKLKKFYYPIYKNATQQGEEKMEKFELNDIEKKACEYLQLDPSSFSNKESLLKEIKAKGLVIENNNLIDNQMETLVYSGAPENDEERKLKEAHEYSLRDDGIDPNDLPSNKKEEELRPTEKKPIAVPKLENLHWIDEKVRDYNGMKEAGNTAITAITPDKSAGTFTAEVDNATVTYSSPNDVTVSRGANYTVFDTMMKEPSNVGKAVRIPEDATPEFKTNLFVAAVLNGHKVNGAEDLTLDAATLAKIGLTAEQEAQLKAALPNAPKEEIQEEKTQEEKNPKPQEEKPSENVVEAIAKLEEPKAKLAELVETGKVSATISSNMKTKKSEIAFNFDATKGGTQADADEANRLLTEALKSVDMLRQKTLPADKDAAHQTAIDNYAIKSAQLNLIRSVYQPEQSETVKAMDRIRAKKLGLIDEEVRKKDGTTVQTLEGNNRNNYETKLSPAILKRVQAAHEVK